MEARRAVVVALSLAAIAAGPAGGVAAKASHESHVLVIRVRSVETAQQLRDVAPRGIRAGHFSKGDTIVLHDRLVSLAPQLGRPAGVTIGTDVSTITFTGPMAATIAGRATFPAGSVRFRGAVSYPVAKPSLVLRVVAGTGAYAGVRGTVSEPTSDNDPSNARNTYRLLLP
jgi:hypothetical protein